MMKRKYFGLKIYFIFKVALGFIILKKWGGKETWVFLRNKKYFWQYPSTAKIPEIRIALRGPRSMHCSQHSDPQPTVCTPRPDPKCAPHSTSTPPALRSSLTPSEQGAAAGVQAYLLECANSGKEYILKVCWPRCLKCSIKTHTDRTVRNKLENRVAIKLHFLKMLRITVVNDPWLCTCTNLCPLTDYKI